MTRPLGDSLTFQMWKGEILKMLKISEFSKLSHLTRGIGTTAMRFAITHYSDWKTFTLVTPVDKSQNVKFYTERCGFDIQSEEMDGSVKVYRFILRRI